MYVCMYVCMYSCNIVALKLKKNRKLKILIEITIHILNSNFY